MAMSYLLLESITYMPPKKVSNYGSTMVELVKPSEPLSHFFASLSSLSIFIGMVTKFYYVNEKQNFYFYFVL